MKRFIRIEEQLGHNRAEWYVDPDSIVSLRPKSCMVNFKDGNMFKATKESFDLLMNMFTKND